MVGGGGRVSEFAGLGRVRLLEDWEIGWVSVRVPVGQTEARSEPPKPPKGGREQKRDPNHCFCNGNLINV